MPDLTFEQFEELLLGAKEATLESIAVWPEPTSVEDALKMLVEKIIDDFENFHV